MYKLGLFVPAPPNVDYTKTYYLSISLKADWMSAARFCQNNGLTLVTLDNPDEIKNFLALCSLNKNFFDPDSWNVALIDGVCPDPDDKTAWVWFSTGKILPPPGWAPGEPNNNNGAIENCLSVIYGSDGVFSRFAFNDIPCCYEQVEGLNSQFVCQELTLKGKEVLTYKNFNLDIS